MSKSRGQGRNPASAWVPSLKARQPSQGEGHPGVGRTSDAPDAVPLCGGVSDAHRRAQRAPRERS